jgi:ribokinase
MARRYDAAVMHDFFVDRLVHTESLRDLFGMVSEKAKGGGGGIHGVGQEEVKGGNAVNLAQALARLGLRTLLITHSDKIHRGLLEEAFSGLDAEVRVKDSPVGLTVAFEEEANVMLGDVGGSGAFGPGELDERDWDALERSRVVCSVNWAANAKGTSLLVALRRRLGREKTVFMDPADFRERTGEFQGLLARISKGGLVDWISMNEREGAETARLLGVETKGEGRVCMELARRLKVVFDLHTGRGSYSSEGTEVAVAPVRTLKARRSTGAGDVWDAGAIYGRLKGMDEVPRLQFANRAASIYLRSKELLPPTAGQVLKG